MPKPIVRTYSAYTKDAIQLLAKLIRIARIERKLTLQEVAERAGISRSMLQRIEKADPKCEIGAIFEVATIVGVALFDLAPNSRELKRELNRSDDKLTLLPKTVHKKKRAIDDDF